MVTVKQEMKQEPQFRVQSGYWEEEKQRYQSQEDKDKEEQCPPYSKRQCLSLHNTHIR